MLEVSDELGLLLNHLFGFSQSDEQPLILPFQFAWNVILHIRRCNFFKYFLGNLVGFPVVFSVYHRGHPKGRILRQHSLFVELGGRGVLVWEAAVGEWI